MFSAWTGTTDTNGLASAALVVPRVSPPLSNTARVHTHVVFFDLGQSRLRSYSENSVEAVLR